MGPFLVSLWMVFEASRLVTGPAGVYCTFPAENHGITIHVNVLPRGASSTDPRDIYMNLNEKVRVRGIVRPTPDFHGDAVLVQGISSQHVTYTIGLHQNGMAVLEIRMPDDARRMREGRCSGHHGAMQQWVAD
ncbi:MAG: hypothetical protein AAFY06_01625 [Pseudomonadota bacterium]